MNRLITSVIGRHVLPISGMVSLRLFRATVPARAQVREARVVTTRVSEPWGGRRGGRPERKLCRKPVLTTPLGRYFWLGSWLSFAWVRESSAMVADRVPVCREWGGPL